MKILLPIIAFAVASAGCSKQAVEPPPPAPPPKAVVHWFTNAEGFIASGVKMNDMGKEVHDPLESAPEFAHAFRDANAQAEAATQHLAGQMGRAHLYWNMKKQVLRDRYRIDWKSPADLNPTTSYD